MHKLQGPGDQAPPLLTGGKQGKPQIAPPGKPHLFQQMVRMFTLRGGRFVVQAHRAKKPGQYRLMGGKVRINHRPAQVGSAGIDSRIDDADPPAEGPQVRFANHLAQDAHGSAGNEHLPRQAAGEGGVLAQPVGPAGSPCRPRPESHS